MPLKIMLGGLDSITLRYSEKQVLFSQKRIKLSIKLFIIAIL